MPRIQDFNSGHDFNSLKAKYNFDAKALANQWRQNHEDRNMKGPLDDFHRIPNIMAYLIEEENWTPDQVQKLAGKQFDFVTMWATRNGQAIKGTDPGVGSSGLQPGVVNESAMMGIRADEEAAATAKQQGIEAAAARQAQIRAKEEARHQALQEQIAEDEARNRAEDEARIRAQIRAKEEARNQAQHTQAPPPPAQPTHQPSPPVAPGTPAGGTPPPPLPADTSTTPTENTQAQNPGFQVDWSSTLPDLSMGGDAVSTVPEGGRKNVRTATAGQTDANLSQAEVAAHAKLTGRPPDTDANSFRDISDQDAWKYPVDYMKKQRAYGKTEQESINAYRGAVHTYAPSQAEVAAHANTTSGFQFYDPMGDLKGFLENKIGQQDNPGTGLIFSPEGASGKFFEQDPPGEGWLSNSQSNRPRGMGWNPAGDINGPSSSWDRTPRDQVTTLPGINGPMQMGGPQQPTNAHDFNTPGRTVSQSNPRWGESHSTSRGFNPMKGAVPIDGPIDGFNPMEGAVPIDGGWTTQPGEGSVTIGTQTGDTDPGTYTDSGDTPMTILHQDTSANHTPDSEKSGAQYSSADQKYAQLMEMLQQALAKPQEQAAPQSEVNASNFNYYRPFNAAQTAQNFSMPTPQIGYQGINQAIAQPGQSAAQMPSIYGVQTAPIIQQQDNPGMGDELGGAGASISPGAIGGILGGRSGFRGAPGTVETSVGPRGTGWNPAGDKIGGGMPVSIPSYGQPADSRVSPRGLVPPTETNYIAQGNNAQGNNAQGMVRPPNANISTISAPPQLPSPYQVNAAQMGNTGNTYQTSALDSAQGRMQGTAPSVAEEQLKRTTERNIAQANAIAQSTRGNNVALQQRNLQNNIANINQQAVADAAMLRAQEQTQAEQNMLNASAQLRQQDIAQAAQNAQLMQEGKLANQTWLNNLDLTRGNQQMQTYLANQQALNQYGLAQAQMNQQTDLANADLSWRAQQEMNRMTEMFLNQGMSQEEARLSAAAAFEQARIQERVGLAQAEAMKYGAKQQLQSTREGGLWSAAGSIISSGLKSLVGF